MGNKKGRVLSRSDHVRASVVVVVVVVVEEEEEEEGGAAAIKKIRRHLRFVGCTDG